MQCRKVRRTQKKQWGFCLIRILLAMALIFIITERMFGEAVKRTLSYQGKRTATLSMSNAILPFLENPKYTYENLSTVSYDNEGRILSISLNTSKLNQMKASMEQEITKALTGPNASVDIPLGTLLGMTLFSQRGPNVTLHTAVYGVVHAKYKSSFKSAGINQTEHTISIVLTAVIETFIPFASATFPITQEFLIAQTVLVGEVPNQLLSLSS